jgi:hypothetical protein
VSENFGKKDKLLIMIKCAFWHQAGPMGLLAVKSEELAVSSDELAVMSYGCAFRRGIFKKTIAALAASAE